jgi:hypothetical protein
MIRSRTLRSARPLVLAFALVPAALGSGITAATAGTGLAPPPEDARLAFRRLEGDARPELILAQRVIDRQWGPADDSIYVELDLPGWKSEPVAAALSAALPGAGQRYVGESSAWVYAALEVAGWSGWWWYRHDAGRLRDQAAGMAGPPADPASGWSFERWAEATQGDPADIAALYRVDPEAFYNAIASDPTYLAGWTSADARNEFGALRIRADARLGRSRTFSTALWLNHLVAAVNALRAARFHNMPLTREVGVRVNGGMRRGSPTVVLALERKF